MKFKLKKALFQLNDRAYDSISVKWLYISI